MTRSQLIDALHGMAVEMGVPGFDWDDLFSEKTSRLEDWHLYLSEFYAYWVVSNEQVRDLVYRYGGSVTSGADFWPDGAFDQSERIIELPSARDVETFSEEINRLLDDNNPVQWIASADDGTAEYLLYYTSAVL